MPRFCRLLSIVFLVALFSGDAMLCATEPPQEADSPIIIEEIEATRDGVGLLTVPVTINNKRYLFFLDTGSTGVVCDVSFRSLLGKPKRSERVNTEAGVFEVPTFDAPESFVGRIRIKTPSSVVVSDLKKFRDLSGVEYYGVIGMSFLKDHILKIDFDKGQIYFLKSVEKNPGRELPLLYKRGVVYTEALIPGFEGKMEFRIATGADANVSGSISNDYINMLTQSRIARPLSSDLKSTSLSGSSVTSSLFRLNAFSLGPFTLRDPIFLSSKKCSNQLDLGCLSRFVVTFDFPHKVMYLKKGKLYDLADGRDCSGLSIARRGGKTVVTNVKSFSPAWQKGIRLQDEILMIEGYGANQTSLYSLRRLLSMEGKNINLVLKRGQESIEASIELK